MATRIGIIREAILNQGGNSDLVYYADNSNGPQNRASGDALYKVERCSDNLTPNSRQLVIDELNKNPDVKHAYLSREYGFSYGNRAGSIGGHIKVRFYGLAKK